MNSLSDGLEKLEQIVKPLPEWVKCGLDEKDDLRIPYSKHGLIVRYVSSQFGTYGIVKAQDRYEAWLRTKAVSGSYVSIDEALAAAEADYRARIASALNLEPILSEIKRMREALGPFAAFADALNEAVPDDVAIGIYADGAMRFGPSGGAHVGDLRIARRALSTLSPQEPDNEPD